ncbi:MAG: helix-turn-helix transcriptional regulator [Luteolibacter sp.]
MASTQSEKFVNVLLLKLRDTRVAFGVSQEQLALISGVDLGVISRAERQLRIPSLASIRDLAKGLDLDFPKLCREVEKALRDKSV